MSNTCDNSDTNGATATTSSSASTSHHYSNGTASGSGSLDSSCSSTPTGSTSAGSPSSLNGNVKKLKLEHENGKSNPSAKSRVVHLRNIPPDTTAADLTMLAFPFGKVTKNLLVRSKGQAFIEFESPLSAIQMANFWIQTTIGGIPSSMQPSIR